MNSIHRVNSLPRLVSGALADRLAVMPAVVVTGARQTGKSTLVEQLVQGERLYRTLDDFDVLDAARRYPEALVGGHEPITLDEVQREPGLLSAVKRAIDRNRSAGRFLLTGSANLLLMRQVSESLAGRASYLTLWPMKDGATCWPPGTSTRRTGVHWRIGAAFPHRPSSWPDRLSAPSGSTVTCAPISSATCRTSPRSAHCRMSAG